MYWFQAYLAFSYLVGAPCYILDVSACCYLSPKLLRWIHLNNCLMPNEV